MSEDPTTGSSRLLPELLDRVLPTVFGRDDDPMTVVASRARDLLAPRSVIVWEGDPETFQFTYVGGDAEAALGHTAARWLEPGFWADTILHPDDRSDAIAFCALATAQRRNHEFEYRARAVDGGVRWLYDVVRVVVGPKGIPVALRGVMIDVTEDKRAAGEMDDRARRRHPELEPAAV